MSFSALISWLDGFRAFLSPADAIDLGLGLSVVLLAAAWLWSRRSLTEVRARVEALVGRVDAQKALLDELEGAQWATDPGSRSRRDAELVRMLGSLLSYSESVRSGSDSSAARPEG